MEVIVNNDAMINNIDTIAYQIIDLASNNADNGINFLTYIKQEQDTDYNKVIRLVYKLTNGSVRCIERGHSSTSIHFIIKKKG